MIDAMKTPDDHDPDGTPIFDADSFGSALEFTHHVTVGTVPVPCWLRIGRTSMKVTADSAKEITRGVLLAELVREHLSR
jgi:hypothetical protein